MTHSKVLQKGITAFWKQIGSASKMRRLLKEDSFATIYLARIDGHFLLLDEDKGDCKF